MPALSKRILVVAPSWVGDAVMATPAMRAIRELYPDAHITCLCRRYVKPVLNGLPWFDRVMTYRTGKSTGKSGRGLLQLSGRLRKGRFATAILLSNSFKTALVCKMAGVKQVVGYDRDGRGFLLTDKLLPRKDKGKFIPTPIVRYYLGLAQYMGSKARSTHMALAITSKERQEAVDVLEHCSLSPDLEHPACLGEGPLVMVNPGAQYGAAKCWPPEQFAAVADRLIAERGATILLSGTPRERRIIDSIQRHMTHAAVDISDKDLSLGALKEIVRRSDLMITNDTGPRHIAAALDVPVVTIFGPTHPEWTEIDFAQERKVAVKVFCGPCQKKKCSLDHRCMTLVTPDMVFNAATELLTRSRVADPVV
jgi:heptosyltransferase II